MSDTRTQLVQQTKREELLEEIERLQTAEYIDCRKARAYCWAFQYFVWSQFRINKGMLSEKFSDEKMLVLQDLALERAKERIRWKKPLVIASSVPLIPIAVGGFLLYTMFSLFSADFPEYKIVKLHDWYKEKYGVWKSENL